MKRILAILLTVALMVPCFANVAYADTGHKVGSLHFSIDMSSVTPGSQPEDFDERSIKVTWTDSGVTWDPNTLTGSCTSGTLKGLDLRIDSLECTTTSKTLKIGDSVKFKFWVTVSGWDDNGKDYYLTSATNAHVGTVSGTTPKVKTVSKHRQNDSEMYITVTSAGITGQFDEPEDLEWKAGNLGQAKWSAPDSGNGTGFYNVRLKRNDKTVYSYDAWNATSFNFYPWMTKEGDYSYEVQCVAAPGTSGGGKKSEWSSSDDQYVAADKVSDGTGQIDPSNGTTPGGGGNKVGWQKINNTWYFYYPDGTMRKNGWEKISSKWYYFDASGAMKTGWITQGNQTYYLDATNGDMKTGWVKTSDGQWYYLNPDANIGTEGAMLKNQFVDAGGKRYYLTNSGAMATGWTKIGNDYYHFGTDGAMSVSTRIDGFKIDSAGRWVKGE